MFTLLQHVATYIRDKVFKSGLGKFCGRQPLKDLKGYAPLNPISVSVPLI